MGSSKFHFRPEPLFDAAPPNRGSGAAAGAAVPVEAASVPAVHPRSRIPTPTRTGKQPGPPVPNA